MVQKTAAIGAGAVVAMSAPTALAVRTAEASGITLVGIARGNEFEIFSHPARVFMPAAAQIELPSLDRTCRTPQHGRIEGTPASGE
jgi:FdhD protein